MADGYWVVVETGQGGWVPDYLHGPYWSAEEAREVAHRLDAGAQRLGRRDRYEVGLIELETPDD